MEGSLRRLALAQRAGQRKEHVLLGGGDGLEAPRVALRKGADDLLDQHFRSRGAGGDAEPPDGAEIVPVDIGGALHQRRARTAGALGYFLEPLRIGRVWGA